jgi:hypothetical protein
MLNSLCTCVIGSCPLLVKSKGEPKSCMEEWQLPQGENFFFFFPRFENNLISQWNTTTPIKYIHIIVMISTTTCMSEKDSLYNHSFIQPVIYFGGEADPSRTWLWLLEA